MPGQKTKCFGHGQKWEVNKWIGSWQKTGLIQKKQAGWYVAGKRVATSVRSVDYYKKVGMPEINSNNLVLSGCYPLPNKPIGEYILLLFLHI